jgi:uncharacterized protein
VVPKRLASLESHELSGGLRVFVARSLGSRLLGLALLAEAPEGCALLFPRCRSVHTFGMRFPLDLVFLDEAGGVMAVSRGVPPCRIVRCRDADSVLETPLSEARRFIRAGAGRVAAGR